MFGPVLGVFVKPIGDDMGWSRATIALAFTAGTFAGAVLPAIVGAFLDRRGARGVIVVSGIIVSGCTIGLALMAEPWHFWAFYGVGRGVAVAGVQLGTTVAIANWFIKKRGRAMAIGGSGLRLGQTALPLVIHAVIVAFSWRHAFGMLAVLSLIFVTIPAGLFMRRRPEDLGLLPDGETAKLESGGLTAAAAPQDAEVSWTLQEARRTRALWLILVAVSATFFVNGSINLHAVANFQDRGIPAVLAVSVTSIIAATSTLTTVVFGFVLERVHVRYGGMLASGCYLAAVLTIMLADSYPMAILFGLLFGVANGGWTTVERLLFADYFGRRSVGAIRGFVAPFRGAISPFGAVLAGFIRDTRGSYTLAFAIFAVMCVVAILALFLAKPPSAPAREPRLG
jgi:MFS family permease